MPAIAASAYTLASTSNSFDRNLHGLLGFLDSPAMITILTVFLISQFGSIGAISGLFYYLALFPFITDALISGFNATRQLTGSASVTEVHDQKEENFIQADAEYSERMQEPSEVLLPQAVSESQSLNNLLTSNWRDNGFREENTIEK